MCNYVSTGLLCFAVVLKRSSKTLLNHLRHHEPGNIWFNFCPISSWCSYFSIFSSSVRNLSVKMVYIPVFEDVSIHFFPLFRTHCSHLFRISSVSWKVFKILNFPSCVYFVQGLVSQHSERQHIDELLLRPRTVRNSESRFQIPVAGLCFSVLCCPVQLVVLRWEKTASTKLQQTSKRSIVVCCILSHHYRS